MICQTRPQELFTSKREARKAANGLPLSSLSGLLHRSGITQKYAVDCGVRDIFKLVEKLKALSDVTRLKILKLILQREYCGCELVEIVGISQSAVSQHLRKLKAAGFVHERRDGQWIYYRGNIRELESFQASFMQFLKADVTEISEMSEELDRLRQLECDSARRICPPGKPNRLE